MLPEYTEDQSQAGGCTHENSTCSFCVVTRRLEQTMTSTVLTRTRIIEKEGNKSNHITVMGCDLKLSVTFDCKVIFLSNTMVDFNMAFICYIFGHFIGCWKEGICSLRQKQTVYWRDYVYSRGVSPLKFKVDYISFFVFAFLEVIVT